MINYKIGNINCKIEWENFLSLTYNNKLYYKSYFDEFPILYEFIDTNIKHITNLLFNGYEYVLRNGVLHNLYGPATLKYNGEGTYMPGTISKRFYIHGRLVFDTVNDTRGCTKLEIFENEEIFYFKELTNKKSGKDLLTDVFYRRKEGIDYIVEPINLEKLRILELRENKLKRILKDG